MLKRLLVGAAAAVLVAFTPAAAPAPAAAPHASIAVLADLAHGARVTTDPHTRTRLLYAISVLDERGTFGVAGSLA